LPVLAPPGFLYHRRFYSYLGSFDWSLRAYSPGKVQMEEMLKWCLDHRVQSYDLLGDPSSFKSDWSNVTAPLMVYRKARTLYGQAYVHLWSDSLRPLLKKVFESMPLWLRSRLIPLVERRAAAQSRARKLPHAAR